MRVTGDSVSGWVRAVETRVVEVPQDDTDFAFRGRLFVGVELDLRRLARGESACYWVARG